MLHADLSNVSVAISSGFSTELSDAKASYSIAASTLQPNVTASDRLQEGPPSYSPLVQFHLWFLEFHGYASVIVCAFGVLTNILNISVLMVKDMRTPTNNFLISLAVADILTMLPYIPFAIHFYCPPTGPQEHPDKFSYGWIFFMVFTGNAVATMHTVSIWLAVSLAAFRFSQIRTPCPRGPLSKERWIRRVNITIVFIYMSSVLILIPSYVHPEIVPLAITNNSNAYGIKHIEMGSSAINPVAYASILIYSVCMKIVPCVLILIFSGSLIYHMGVKTAQRRQRLSSNVQQAKTTRMLLVVLVLFICVELPQGILLLLAGTVPQFYSDVYYHLSDVLDFISLLNNAINFILYCMMSQQFREKFIAMYINRCYKRERHMLTSPSELLMLREHQPKTTTTTTHYHDEHNNVKL